MTCSMDRSAKGQFSFFKSKFHCFDAAIIVAGFVIDVCKYKKCPGSRGVFYSLIVV